MSGYKSYSDQRKLTGDMSEYIDEAIRSAVVTLQWQASDATAHGNGYPISEEGDEYTDRIIDEVPYISEAIGGAIRELGILALYDVPAASFGHNFILSANGHGTGFWDTDYDHADLLDQTARGHSIDAEFALDPDTDEVAFLCVENTVIVDEMGVCE